ncbi:MAG: hypothetical protein ACYSR5_05910 [Planctomycetota bacterium]|jgi:hypothetical protein
MRVLNSLKMVVAVGALASVLTGYVRADKLGLQERLGKDVSVQLKDVTIAEALGKIGQKAGVKVVLSDEAAWKLPNGEATRLSVVLRGPLADSMTEMLSAFFMRYAVGDEEVTVYPRAELKHILGRPTTGQLELLKAVYTRPVRVYFLDELQRSINEALGREVLVSPIHVHAQLNTFLRQLVAKDEIFTPEPAHGRGRRRSVGGRAFIEARQSEPNEPGPTEFDLPTPVTLVQLLSQVSLEGEEPRYTRWYISRIDFPGQVPEIRVVGSSAFRGLEFEQKIDVSYKDQALDKIFRDLASRAGIELRIEPGSFLNEIRVSVDMQNVTVKEAATGIADISGARCEFEKYGHLQISWPARPKGKDEELRRSSKVGGDGYVGKISIPMNGGEYFVEFMLRESDLTEELKELRRDKMKVVLGEAPEAGEKQAD